MDTSILTNGDIPSYRYTPREVALSIQAILPYVSNGLLEASGLAEDPGRLIPNEIFDGIQQWLQTNTSTVLWVEGPNFISELSSTAFRVCNILADADIPNICFFEQMRYLLDMDVPDPKEAGTICLLYTLISHLVDQLPPAIEMECDMDPAYFRRLDASWGSSDAALEVFRYLLRHAPSDLVIIIHGIDVLEGDTTNGVLGRLVDIIRGQNSDTRVKAFFSTDGTSQVLGDRMGRAEQVGTSRMGQHREGNSSLLDDLRL